MPREREFLELLPRCWSRQGRLWWPEEVLRQRGAGAGSRKWDQPGLK